MTRKKKQTLPVEITGSDASMVGALVKELHGLTSQRAELMRQVQALDGVFQKQAGLLDTLLTGVSERAGVEVNRNEHAFDVSRLDENIVTVRGQK